MRDKYIRLLIDNTRFVVTENSERIEYVRIPSERTGLPYDIFIDNNMSYKRHGHELWMYVDCKGVKIPVTIEENPKVKRFIYGHRCDMSLVYDFIRVNRHLLINMANRKTNEHVFFHLLKRVNESKTAEIKMINEMATLHKDISNLPTTLWIDDDKTYLPHAPRIKFKMGDDEANTRQYTSMEIHDPDRLHNVPKKSRLSKQQLEQIKNFVRVNKQLLLDLSNNVIEFETFKDKMKKVDIKGNIINNAEIEIGKFINGFAIYRENDKYNYIRENGELLFADNDLDYASNFNNYGDNILLALVCKNGREFYIDDEGKEVSFK